VKNLSTDEIGFEGENSVEVVFDGLEDPRIDRHKLYPISEIFFLTLAASLVGVRSWRGAETFGIERLEWLRGFFPFEEGIPSHQTIGRVFSLVKPAILERAFVQFMTAATKKSPEQIIALDGKTLRGSFDKAKGQKALHILNACAIENGLSLGQLTVGEKTNEITAVPELLDILDLKNATITTDALNTQKDIAQKVISSNNDYVLPVKGNQKNLLEEIQQEFETTVANIDGINFLETTEKGHGRIDKRTYTSLPAAHLHAFSGWPGLQSIGMAVTESQRGEKTTREVRYYIISFLPDVKRFANAVRGHWGVENKLHWSLDVTFGEDASRIRKDHAPVNFSLVRKLALNLMRNEKTCRKSIPQKMIKASLNPDYHTLLLKSGGF
jgi:predicted transposase YbfD/YdcC